MAAHRGLGILVLTIMFLSPALILLFFSWSVRISNRQPSIQTWRLETYKWALLLASASTAWFLIFCLHYLGTGEPAQGFWLFMNRIGILVWAASLVASLAGKGAGRILLFCWGITLFCGVFGIDSAMIP